MDKPLFPPQRGGGERGRTMAYNAAAVALRRCTATTRAGAACKGWAMWDDPEQRCCTHAGKGHQGPLASRFARLQRRRRTVPGCRCAAYNWPHRPGSGLCRWPEAPRHQLTTPAHSHSICAMRRRCRDGSTYYEERNDWRGWGRVVPVPLDAGQG